MADISSLLNPEQYSAVVQINGANLILAGAGSGKTRVITYKIAHLINNGIRPENILAVTFTNKAAREMKERVSRLLKVKKLKVLITTFHSLGVKILRKEINKLNYREKFSIYDEYDCKKVIKEIIRELKLPEDKYDPNTIIYKISDLKMNLSEDIKDKNIERIYKLYSDHLKTFNAVDFNDLIKLPIDIFQEFPDVLRKYQEKWKYILVDEYQDTSVMQYNFIKLLAIKYKNISVVGDDDQSIYSWRGANPQNITLFETDFYPVNIVKLEQNYRSSGNILNAANNIIKNNNNRKSKKLWTEFENGDAIKIFEAEDEEREAEFVTTMIKRFIRDGYNYSDIGVLFRMNSQSRPFEEFFRENDLPYKLVGAMNFFERQEIKDIVAYMRFLSNLDDEVSLLRIINNPKRGIGNTTVNSLMEHAKKTDSALYSTIKDCIYTNLLGKKITPYLEDFYNLIEKYRERIFKPKNIEKSVYSLIEEIDYKGKLIMEFKDTKKVTQRMYNINQLLQSINRYENDPDNFNPNIFEYLQRISLNTKDDDSDKNNNSINMMSIHSAKGLEFKIVFIVGAENDLLPHHKTIIETGNVEEERRLFYVAITRAREKLFLTYSKARKKFNEIIAKDKSEFILELPENLLEDVSIENEINPQKSFEALLEKMKNDQVK